MKLAVALASLLVFTGLAHADRYDGERTSPDQRRERLRHELVERFDRNGDGQLQPHERKRAAKALRRMAKHWERAGQRSGERAGRRPDHERGRGRVADRRAEWTRPLTTRERLIRRFDRNGDGQLGPGELPPRIVKKLLKLGLDRDGNGWIEPHELP